MREDLTIDGQKISFDYLESKLFEYGKSRNWDSKLAKWGLSGEQCLLAHALNTYAVAKKICLKLEKDLGLSNFSILVALVSAFLHDNFKETDEYQREIGKGTALEHAPIKPEEVIQLKNIVKEILTSLDLKLEETRLCGMLDKVFTASAEHMKGQYDLADAIKILGSGTQRDSRIVNIVITADTIASWKSLDAAKKETPLLSGRCKLFYHRVARTRGLLTSVLHKTMERIAENSGAEALLTYADGTLYLGDKDAFQSLNRNNIVSSIEDELRQIMTESEEKVANAIIGRPGRKILKAPELLNEKNVNIVLEGVSRRAGTFAKAGSKSKEYIIKRLETEKNPKDAQKIARGSIKDSIDSRWDSLSDHELENYKEKYFPGLSTGIDPRKVIIDAEAGRLVEAAGDGFILCFLAQYKKYLEKEFGKKSIEKLSEAFVYSFDKKLWGSLDSLGGNNTVQWRLLVIDYFWNLPAEKLGFRSNRVLTVGLIDQIERRKLLVKKLTRILVESDVLKSDDSSSNLKKIAELLVNSDLVVPAVGQLGVLLNEAGKPKSATELVEVYKRSKDIKEKDGVCSICGLPGEVFVATADLVGEGSESFTNKLPAGVTIGGTCKARICALCRQEGILRSMLGVPAATEVILLIPQVNTSREIFKVTAKAFEEMIALQLKGWVPLTSYNEVAVAAAKNQINLNEVTAFLPRNRSRIVMIRTEANLKDEFSDNLNDASQYLDALGLKIPDEPAWDHIVTVFLDNIELIKQKDPALFSLLRQSSERELSYVYETQHFAAILRRTEIKLVVRRGKEIAEESSSGAALRKLLVGLAFSKVMMCSVVFLSGLHILEEMVPKGAVKIPEVHNALALIREWMGRNESWISLRYRDRLLCLLGSVLVVARHTDFGVDSGFRSANLNAGELLRRLEMNKVGLPTQIKLLNNLEIIERRYEGW